MKLLEINLNVSDLIKIIKDNDPFVIVAVFLIVESSIWGMSKQSDLNITLSILLRMGVFTLSLIALFFSRGRFRNRIDIKESGHENLHVSMRKETMIVEDLILNRLEKELSINIHRQVSKLIHKNNDQRKSFAFSGVSYDRENTMVIDVTYIRDCHCDENRLISLINNISYIRETFERDIPFNLFTLIIAIGYEEVDIKALKDRLFTFKESMNLGKNRVEIKTFNLRKMKIIN